MKKIRNIISCIHDRTMVQIMLITALPLAPAVIILIITGKVLFQSSAGYILIGSIALLVTIGIISLAEYVTMRFRPERISYRK